MNVEIYLLPTTKTEEELRKIVVDEAKTWEFTPSRHRGQVKGLDGGVDCGSFLFSVFKACGIIGGKLPDNYSPQWWAHREDNMYLDQAAACYDVKPDIPTRTPKPGDIILFTYGRTYGHGAIVLDYPMGIHLHPKAAHVSIDRLDMGESFIGRNRQVCAIKGWS